MSNNPIKIDANRRLLIESLNENLNSFRNLLNDYQETGDASFLNGAIMLETLIRIDTQELTNLEGMIRPARLIIKSLNEYFIINLKGDVLAWKQTSQIPPLDITKFDIETWLAKNELPESLTEIVPINDIGYWYMQNDVRHYIPPDCNDKNEGLEK